MSRGAGGDTPALTPLGTRAGGVGQPLLSTAQSPDLWQAGKSRPYLVIWEDLRCYASKIVFTPVFPPPYRVYFRKNGLDSAVWGVCVQWGVQGIISTLPIHQQGSHGAQGWELPLLVVRPSLLCSVQPWSGACRWYCSPRNKH